MGIREASLCGVVSSLRFQVVVSGLVVMEMLPVEPISLGMMKQWGTGVSFCLKVVKQTKGESHCVMVLCWLDRIPMYQVTRTMCTRWQPVRCLWLRIQWLLMTWLTIPGVAKICGGNFKCAMRLANYSTGHCYIACFIINFP